MVVSSRTPEGLPSRCVLCGAENKLEFSDPGGDAPCPSCGHLLWFSARLLGAFQNRLAGVLAARGEPISPDTTLAGLGADSLDLVELVMQLEEEFDLEVPVNMARSIETVGDAIRYIEQRRRGQQGSE